MVIRYSNESCPRCQGEASCPFIQPVPPHPLLARESYVNNAGEGFRSSRKYRSGQEEMKASEEVKRTVWIERSWLNDTVFKSLTMSQHQAVWVEDYEGQGGQGVVND